MLFWFPFYAKKSLSLSMNLQSRKASLSLSCPNTFASFIHYTCNISQHSLLLFQRYHFSFGDGATCDYNYCKHSFSRGLYKPKGVASNDFYQSSLERTLIICPASNPGVSYTPTINGGGIGIEYLGMNEYDFYIHALICLKRNSRVCFLYV